VVCGLGALMPTGKPLPKSGSLGARLVLGTLGFCFVFTLLAVGARTWSAWQEAWAAMDAELTLVEQVYRQTLSKAIWEMDRESLQAHMDSAARVASVGHIVLRINASNSAPELMEHTASGWTESTVAPTRRLNLSYQPFPGGNELVGELTLSGDERVLWARLRSEVKGIVVTQLLQSLLLAGLVMLMFSRSVTVHVQHMARHLSQLTPDRLGQTLRLLRSPKRQDELTLLESGINLLQGKLVDHLAQLQLFDAELAEHRDRLAELVQARTTELESLTQAQQLVLSLSNRLNRAPHGAFDDCQKSCLQDVAQRLGVRRALWLVPDSAATGQTVFADWQPRGMAPAAPVDPTLFPALQKSATLALREDVLLYASQAELRRSLGKPLALMLCSADAGACALAPLRSGNDDFGLLFFEKPQAQGDWAPQERALLALTAQMLLHSARHKAQLTNILGTQEALRAANQQLEALTRHDALTGLFNRRHFDTVKDEEFQRAMRSGLPLSLLVCDIDHFKNFNDHYGHAQGDQCLRAVARALQSVITRSGDTLARIGGEEFAIVLPAADEAAALQLAQRVRQAVADLQLPHAASEVGPCVTLSIGVAQLDLLNMGAFDGLFEAADMALYRAKKNGRNRVECKPAASSRGAVPYLKGSDA
jgi:diguanylate cyclase (GGDEF)-like protein